MSILQKIRDFFNCGSFNPEPVYYDYYNGSENELENIFLELQKIANEPITVYNQECVKNRINFLAEEGLSILDIYNVQSTGFKFTKEELDAIIAPPKPKKKTTKKKTTKKK